MGPPMLVTILTTSQMEYIALDLAHYGSGGNIHTRTICYIQNRLFLYVNISSLPTLIEITDLFEVHLPGNVKHHTIWE